LAVAEFLGTFLLVFAGPGAVVIDAVSGGGVTPLGIGLAFGLAVAAAIVIFGPVSGAHINPAVSLAFASQGQFAWSQVPLFVLCQLAGAAAASAVHRALFGTAGKLGATLPTTGVADAFVLELVLTFFLVLVVFSVATDRRIDQRLAAAAIGGYVALAASFAGPIAGASMNPARSFGPALLSGEWYGHWAYWLAPALGAILAAAAFRLLRPDALARSASEDVS
jgi:MIP family channel proteins